MYSLSPGALLLHHRRNRDRVSKFKAVKAAQKYPGPNRASEPADRQRVKLRWTVTFVIAIIAAHKRCTGVRGDNPCSRFIIKQKKGGDQG